jgi:thiol-disulfide isomerase/thioredoxin
MRIEPFARAAAAAIVSLSLLSCDQHSVNGRFAGLDDGVVVVEYAPLNRGDEPVRETLRAKGGRFTLDLQRQDTVMLYFHFPDQARKLPDGQPFRSMSLIAPLVLEPGGRISLRGSVEDPDFVSYSIPGGGFNADYAAHREVMRELSMRVDSIEIALAQIERQNADDMDAARPLLERYAALSQQMNTMRRAYVEANPDTDLAADYVSMQSADDFDEWYQMLGQGARRGLFATVLGDLTNRHGEYKIRKDAAANVAPGAMAPGFTLTSLDDRQVSLSEIEGEYIVLDFWGSWCVWCIRGFPEMKKYHDKYRGRLTIVGIACRDTREAWRKGVADNALPWLQLLNDQSGDISKDVSALYAVQGFPTKVILDRDHRIVEVVVGEDPAFYEKLDALFD